MAEAFGPKDRPKALHTMKDVIVECMIRTYNAIKERTDIIPTYRAYSLLLVLFRHSIAA